MDTDLLAEGSEQALEWVLGLIPSTVTSRDNRPQWGPGFHWKELPPPKLFTPAVPHQPGFLLDKHQGIVDKKPVPCHFSA